MVTDPLSQAIAAHQAGRLDEARTLYTKVLAAQPTNPSLNQVMGLLELQAGQLAAATQHFEVILQTQPNAAAALRGRAQALLAGNDPARAEIDLRSAIATDPSAVEGHTLLASAFDAQDRPDDALTCLKTALALKPGEASILKSKARILREAGRVRDAYPLYEAIAQALPHDADAQASFGTILWEYTRYEDALATLDRALALNPNHTHAQWNRAMVLLMLGRDTEGWAAYDTRWASSEKSPPHADLPHWQGEPLEGRAILLGSEQGFGDVIQFIRLAPLVAERGGRVVVEARPELAELLGTCDGITEIWTNTNPRPEADIQIPLASLPNVLKTTTQTLPPAMPYLFPPPGPDIDLGALDRPRVGLVWSGQQVPRANRKRSMKPEDLAPILAVTGITFVSLQIGGDVSVLQDVAGPAATILDAAPQLTDFGATARAMAACDAIISIDTGAAHLAGALGRPGAVLLPYAPDWRWGPKGDTTPWYPTLQLCRQQEIGDWSAPATAAAAWLRNLLARRPNV